jgi:hypothetical protein
MWSLRANADENMIVVPRLFILAGKMSAFENVREKCYLTRVASRERS